MRYRVEVEQTVIHQVEVDADTVEDAIEQAIEMALYEPDDAGDWSLPTVRDAVEAEPAWPVWPAIIESARCEATRNDSQCVYYGAHTLPHRAYDEHRSEFTWQR